MKGLQVDGVEIGTLPYKEERAYLLKMIELTRGNIRLTQELLPSDFWWDVLDRERALLKWLTRRLTELKRELKEAFGN